MIKNASVNILLASLLAAGVDASSCPQKWYPNGGSAWTDGFCNFACEPNGNYGQGYSTNLACCKGYFGGQVSGVCLSKLASPPTTSPTISGGLVDFW